MTSSSLAIAHLCDWLTALLDVQFIQSHQSEARPALPYGVVQLVSAADVRELPHGVEWETLDTENSEGMPEVRATPRIEREWTFQVQCYGDGCVTRMERVAAAVHLDQMQEPLLPEYVIHEVGVVTYVPDLVSQRWEPRAIATVTVRGVSSDGFVVDVIESQEPLVIERT